MHRILEAATERRWHDSSRDAQEQSPGDITTASERAQPQRGIGVRQAGAARQGGKGRHRVCWRGSPRGGRFQLMRPGTPGIELQAGGMNRVQGSVGKAGIETRGNGPKDPREDLSRERVRADDGFLSAARTGLRCIHGGFHPRRSGRSSVTAARTTRVRRSFDADQILAEHSAGRKPGAALKVETEKNQPAGASDGGFAVDGGDTRFARTECSTSRRISSRL